MRGTTLAGLLIALIAMLLPGATAARVSDAQLLGMWSGEWKVEQAPGVQTTPRRGQPTNGSYQITINRVDKGKVFGQVQQSDVTPQEYKFLGKLEGNVLSYGNERYQTSLTIDGDRMKGTMLGGTMPWQISLRKKK
jgi:hypothetical protein